jgi:hypothetical protein
MPELTQESDWKYLKSIKHALLSTLCERINLKAQEILQLNISSPHEKYMALYRHIEESDAIVADCFDDWRRSTLFSKIAQLYHHELISEEQLGNLSENARYLLAQLVGSRDKSG